LGEIVKSIDVDATATQVYSYVVDPRNAPRYISSITRVISGPEGEPKKGEVWLTEANLLGRMHQVNLRLDDAVADRAVRFVLEGDPQAVIVLQMRPDSKGDSTSVSLTLEVPGVPTILLNAMLGGLLDADLVRLKKNLE